MATSVSWPGSERNGRELLARQSGKVSFLMKSKYRDLIAEDKILDFVRVKYGINKSYDEILVTDPYYRFIRIIDLIKKMGIVIGNEDAWLDLGCHHGQFLNLVHRTFNCNLIGIDDWDLKSAMPFAEFEYHASNLADQEWPALLRGEKAKFVSALEVIEHMIDTDQFVHAIGDVVSDDGILFLSTPNINSLRNRVLVPFGIYPAYMEFRNQIHHVRLFNINAIGKLLHENGFEVRRCIGVSFLPERFLRFPVLRKVSEILADYFPALCGSLIVVAIKKDANQLGQGM